MKNLISKLLISLLLLMATNAFAQKKDTMNMSQLQEQLKAAQEMIKKQMAGHSDEIQRGLQQAQAHTAIAVMQSNKIPDSVLLDKNFTPPDPSKVLSDVSTNLNKNMAALQKMQGSIHQSLSKNLPQKGTSSFSAVPNGNRAQVIAFAQQMLPIAIAGLKKLDLQLPDALDAMIKADTTMSIQGKGMLMMADHEPKFMVEYMVCKGVLANPNDPWAINDLGVVLDNESRYKDAAVCFKYAYGPNPNFIVIKNNLAWAVAYYGDFITAKQYFNDILAKAPDYQLAWEGLGMIAYQQGDIATLFQCLAHQVKTIGSGGAGPSEEFTSFVDAVNTEQTTSNIGKQSSSDPTQDNTFDNNSGEDGDNQDPPANGNSEPPTYPESMSVIFAKSIDDLVPMATKVSANTALITKKIKEAADKTAAKLHAINRRLAPATYTDDQGMHVTPANFTRYYKLFHDIHVDFQKRCSFIYKQYDDDFKTFTESWKAQQISINGEYRTDIGNCKFSDERQQKACVDQVACKWKPKSRGDLGMNLEAISKLYSKYIQKIRDQADWYISASTPDIKRVLDPGWNDYMNAIREQDIRQAILSMYDKWIPTQTLITGSIETGLANDPTNCFTPLREIPATGPDPRDVKLKKLKTFPKYCDRSEPATDVKAGGFEYYDDCDRTRFGFSPPTPLGVKGGIGVGPFKAEGQVGITFTFVLEQVRSRKFQEDNYWNNGVEIGIGASGSAKVGGSVEKGSLHGGVEGSVEGNGTATVQFGTRFDSDFNVTGKYVKGDVNLGVTGNANASVGAGDIGDYTLASGSAAAKGEAHGEVFTAVGPNGSPGKSTYSGSGSFGYE